MNAGILVEALEKAYLRMPNSNAEILNYVSAIKERISRQ